MGIKEVPRLTEYSFNKYNYNFEKVCKGDAFYWQDTGFQMPDSRYRMRDLPLRNPQTGI